MDEKNIKQEIEKQLSINISECFWKDDSYIMYETTDGKEIAFCTDTFVVIDRNNGNELGKLHFNQFNS